MRIFFVITLIIAGLLMSGCFGNEEKKRETEVKKDHVLRSQMDALQSAKNLKQDLNDKMDERNREAEKLTH